MFQLLSRLVWLSVYIALVGVSGCGRAAPSSGAPGSFAEDREVRRRMSVPVVEAARSGSSAEFTSVTSLDVDSHGHIYVGDWYRQQVTVLGPDGVVLRTLGRRGDGPGEFRSIRGIQVLPGDSLLVYDPNLARITVFPADHEKPAYIQNLGERLNGTTPFLLWRTPENDGMVALFRPQFTFRQGETQAARTDYVSLLNVAGEIVWPRVLSFPSKSFLVAEESITPNPFGREGIVRSTARGQLHRLWTDSAAVVTYDRTGQRVGGFVLPFTAGEVTASDASKALESMGHQVRAIFERALQDSLPARWPAVREMLVDDRYRIWLGLTSPSGTLAEWAVVSEQGAYLGSVVLPSGTELRAIRGQMLYAVQSDDSDVPQVVVYHLQRGLDR